MKNVFVMARDVNFTQNNPIEYFCRELNQYGLKFYSSKDFKYMSKKKIDNFCLIYGATYLDPEIINFVQNNDIKNLWWLTNEYDLTMNSGIYKIYRECGYNIVANYFQKTCKIKQFKRFETVNLNAICLNDYPEQEKKFDLLHYSHYRKGRAIYYKRYFENGQYLISTSKRSYEKFQKQKIKAKYIDVITIHGNKNLLGQFKYSLYLEDIFTHTNYNHPANRFYEAISAKTLQLFDVNCKNTFKIADYDINDYIVTDQNSLQDKIKQIETDGYNKHLQRQLSLFRTKAEDEKKEAIKRLQDIFNSPI